MGHHFLLFRRDGHKFEKYLAADCTYQAKGKALEADPDASVPSGMRSQAALRTRVFVAILVPAVGSQDERAVHSVEGCESVGAGIGHVGTERGAKQSYIAGTRSEIGLETLAHLVVDIAEAAVRTVDY